MFQNLLVLMILDLVPYLRRIWHSPPLGARFKVWHEWNGIIERMEGQLASWKRLYLSKRGRLTLIKGTLSNLPIYFRSLFPNPKNHVGKVSKGFFFYK